MAAEEFENLKEFVELNELERVQTIVKKMSSAQRHDLAIDKDDIWLSFPLDVVLIEKQDKNAETQTTRIFAEVLMVFHVFKNQHIKIYFRTGYDHDHY